MAAGIRLYLDENLTPKVAIQLRRRGIDIVTVHDLGTGGDSGENHLARAAKMGRVLVTADTDYLALAASGVDHAGIVFGSQIVHSIGSWVRSLELICAVYDSDDMRNHIEYL